MDSLLREFKTQNENVTIEVSVHGKSTKGYYMSIYPVKYEVIDGITMKSIELFSGETVWLYLVNRLSKTREMKAREIAKKICFEFAKAVAEKRDF